MVKKLRNTAYLVANDKEFKVELSEFIPNYFEVDKFIHSSGVNSKAEKDGIRIEEVFHMFTQYAYGLQWPKLFGTGRSILNYKYISLSNSYFLQKNIIR